MTHARATVTGSHALGARFRRIDLSVPDLPSLGLPHVGDAAVGVYLPAPGQRHAPEVGDDAEDADDGPEGRNYTVRLHEPGSTRVSIDVVLHASGPGTEWARHASVGDSVVLGHARSWYAPDAAAEWQLLAADLSGLPALARILVESRPDAHLLAAVEVLDDADLAYLNAPAHVELVTTVGTGNGTSASRLADLVTGLDLPEGRGYCWFAGEAAESRTVRKHVRARGWTADQFDVVGYWRHDSEAWDRRFAAVSDEMVTVYTNALAAGDSEKIASERFDEALERAGL